MRCPHCGKEIAIYDYLPEDKYEDRPLWNTWFDFSRDEYMACRNKPSVYGLTGHPSTGATDGLAGNDLQDSVNTGLAGVVTATSNHPRRHNIPHFVG